ncbi:MAG: hypothetical protein KQA34_00995 [Candidatus Aenigmarchaeota archaeon]|nr:hypothetical protein [Candidatus Aenigmarchaeota archaeon]
MIKKIEKEIYSLIGIFTLVFIGIIMIYTIYLVLKAIFPDLDNLTKIVLLSIFIAFIFVMRDRILKILNFAKSERN